jgi:hypothetical protein
MFCIYSFGKALLGNYAIINSVEKGNNAWLKEDNRFRFAASGAVVLLSLVLIVGLSVERMGRMGLLHISSARPYFGGRAAIRIGDGANASWGFVDTMGKTVIGCQYERVGNFRESLAPVRKNKMWGFIDETGDEAVPFKYDAVSYMDAGLAICMKYGEGVSFYVYDFNDFTKSGIVGFADVLDKTGINMMDSINEQITNVRVIGKSPRTDRWYFSFEIAEVKYKCSTATNLETFFQEVKYNEGLRYSIGGFWNPAGKLEIIYVLDSLSLVRLNAVPGTVEDKPMNPFPGSWRDLKNIRPVFSEGLCAIPQSGKFGFIDRSGKTVIDFIYDNALPFNEGLAAVNLNGEWFFINREGNRLSEETYSWVNSFSEGRALVRKGDDWSFINKQGVCEVFCH